MKTIVPGEKAEFTMQLATKDAAGVVRPYDLTGYVEISVTWKAGSGSLTKNKVGSPVGVEVLGLDTDGRIKGTLAVADTGSLAKSATGTIQVKVDKGSGNVKIFQKKNDAFAVSEAV